MLDMEKVIKGLERCKLYNKVNCDKCPYDYNGRGDGKSECTAELATDVLELLKEQKPSVDEFQDFIYHEHFRQRLSAENLAYLNLWINKFKEDIVRKSADEKLMEEMDADPLG